MFISDIDPSDYFDYIRMAMIIQKKLEFPALDTRTVRFIELASHGIGKK